LRGGGERSETQTYLNELILCYGADRRVVGARFEDAHTAKRPAADYVDEVDACELRVGGHDCRDHALEDRECTRPGLAMAQHVRTASALTPWPSPGRLPGGVITCVGRELYVD
jgi:hypothetical protein